MAVSSVERSDKKASTQKSRARNARYALAFLFCVMAVAEILLFKHYYQKFIAPYYPVLDDQLATYLWVYKAHYQLANHGLGVLWQDQNLFSGAAPFKGPLVPFTSLLSSFLLGPSRFSVGVTNLLLFLLGQLALVLFLSKRPNALAAALGLGLFLIAGTHYMYVGGLSDLRLDYAGMIFMGVTFLCACNWLENGDRKRFLLAALAVVFSALTRSILLFYWLGATLLASGILLIACPLVKQYRTEAVRLRNRMLALLSIVASVFIFQVLLFLPNYRSYYFHCKTSGEDIMRMQEAGVHNLAERLLYYPLSFLNHCGSELTALGIVLALVVVIPWTMKLAGFSRLNDRESPKNVSFVLCFIFGTLALSVMVLTTSYAPQPVVAGVLTLPLIVCSAEVLGYMMQRNLPKEMVAAICALVFGVGCWTFVHEMRHPTYKPHPDVVSARMTNVILSDLIDDVTHATRQTKKLPVIYWTLVNQGINQRTFDLMWHERRRTGEVGANHLIVPAFPDSTWDSIRHNIEISDFVVAPIKLPALEKNQFEFYGTRSIRKALPKMQECLSQSFELSSDYALSNNFKVGIFRRRIPTIPSVDK
jgi:hypothetical protein